MCFEVKPPAAERKQEIKTEQTKTSTTPEYVIEVSESPEPPECDESHNL